MDKFATSKANLSKKSCEVSGTVQLFKYGTTTGITFLNTKLPSLLELRNDVKYFTTIGWTNTIGYCCVNGTRSYRGWQCQHLLCHSQVLFLVLRLERIHKVLMLGLLDFILGLQFCMLQLKCFQNLFQVNKFLFDLFQLNWFASLSDERDKRECVFKNWVRTDFFEM